MAKKNKGNSRVSKDGRLVLPSRTVQKHGLTPGDLVNLDKVELDKNRWSRRGFFRFVGSIAAAGAIPLAYVSFFEDRYKDYQDRIESIESKKQGILSHLFGSGSSGWTSLIPAGDHPFKPPPDGLPWYPNDVRCSNAYRKRFLLDDTQLRTVRGFTHVRPDDSVVLFGAQISNLATRTIMGNPWKEFIQSRVEGAGWRTRLIWNHHSPIDATMLTRTQFGGEWMTKDHVIVDCRTGKHIKAPRSHHKEDYLLVTALPRYSSKTTRTLIFSGLHGPGTLGSIKFFSEPNLELLEKLHEKVNQSPFYQALFEVELQLDSSGEPAPQILNLVDAVELKVAFK